jgi:Protein of unknown function (DUF3738)
MHEDFSMNIAVRRLPKLLNIALPAAAFPLPCAVPLRGQSRPALGSSSDKPAVAASQPSISGSSAKPNLPKFRAATIKPAAPSDDNMLMFTPDGVSIHGIPMKMLLRESFGVEDDRILGEPGWVKNRYDIETKVDPDDAPKLKNRKMHQRRAMLLPLLEERFNLKYHQEARELPMYALVVAKGGLKMKASAPEDPPQADDSQKPGDGEAPPPGDDRPRTPRVDRDDHGNAGPCPRTAFGPNRGEQDRADRKLRLHLQWTPENVGTPMGRQPRSRKRRHLAGCWRTDALDRA